MYKTICDKFFYYLKGKKKEEKKNLNNNLAFFKLFLHPIQEQFPKKISL